MLRSACSFLKLPSLLLLLAAGGTDIAAADPPELMAQHVYDRLARAVGLINPPKLMVQAAKPGSPDRVAFMRTIPGPLPRREIVIDDKTITICEGLGAQAESCVAYFLGHELAHFANNHHWGSHFARKAVDDTVTPAQSLEYETQADRFGGFYAALAGFDALAVAPKALELVYHAYGITPNLPGYLSLANRQKVPQDAREFLAGLLPVFDAAGLLMALGYYQEAAAHYDAILDQFPSREIYNNAGVALASLCDPRVAWLLDGSTRLPEHAGRRGAVDIAAVSAQAREHFEKAISLDRDYPVAHWNLGLLLKMRGEERERAEAERKTAISLNKDIESSAAAPGSVGADPPKLDAAALLPGGKHPADLVPANPDPVVKLAGGLTFFSRTLNGQSVFSVRPIGPDHLKLIAALVPQMPDQWKGALGKGKVIPQFPENATLYESLGVLVGVRGALVYQLH